LTTGDGLATGDGLTWFTAEDSLDSSSSILFISCVILASAAIEDSIECIPVLEVVGVVFSGHDSHWIVFSARASKRSHP